MLKELFSLNLFGYSLGIDLGTTNTVVYRKGRGIVLNMPTVMALRSTNGEVIGVGEEARLMLGKTPQNIRAVRPLQDGVVADYDITRKMVSHFLSLIQPGRALIGPRLIIGVPSAATRVEKRALVDIAQEVGARRIHLVEEPVAAVIGADLPISEPLGNMVVDIGGGTSEAAITSLNGVVVSRSIRVAGDEMNLVISQYLREEYNLYIGEQMAENIKVNIGCALTEGKKQKMKARGRDLKAGFPHQVEVDSGEISSVLSPVIHAILDMIEATLEASPPALAGDIMERGIYLTGGGACLKRFDEFISAKIKLPVWMVPEPLFSVVTGLGRLLDNPGLLSQVEVTANLR
jgi:rod shape-determining protein MreB